MSIQSEMNRIKNNIDSSLGVVASRGVAVPENANSDSLPMLIQSIPTGISEAIIDVTELPTEDINEDVFYRIPNGTFYFGKDPLPTWSCIVVETLPDEGIAATYDMENFTLYYEAISGNVYVYIDDMLGNTVGIPTGWYPIEAIMSLFGGEWGGIVFNETETTVNDAKTRLLITYVLFQYKNMWEKVKGIGSTGTGAGAEVFNTVKNQASGKYSHAEGYLTLATGATSHAEGGDSAALGISSHAEGQATTAVGDYSHSEGYSTIATGDNQHVQGKYNIEDTEDKYAHIVGNGQGDGMLRSNAHTLDWDGVAWFAGDVRVGGSGQDDEDAEVLATQGYVDNAIANKDPTFGVDQIRYVEQNQSPDSVHYHESFGIGITNTTRFLDENDSPITECPFDQFIPLVAGDGISIVEDEENSLLKISATGSTGDSGLPEYTDSDIGGFLRLALIDGVVQPKWVNIPNAEDHRF